MKYEPKRSAKSANEGSLLLLDVNVLLALGWREHVAHLAVLKRLQSAQSWATCTITQLGFIRISSIPGVFHQPLTASAAADFLTDLTSHPAHQYLSDALAPTSIAWPAHAGYKQMTDVYLLALAAHSNAILLTLDLRLQRAFPTLAMETIAV